MGLGLGYGSWGVDSNKRRKTTRTRNYKSQQKKRTNTQIGINGQYFMRMQLRHRLNNYSIQDVICGSIQQVFQALNRWLNRRVGLPYLANKYVGGLLKFEFHINKKYFFSIWNMLRLNFFHCLSEIQS